MSRAFAAEADTNGAEETRADRSFTARISDRVCPIRNNAHHHGAASDRALCRAKKIAIDSTVRIMVVGEFAYQEIEHCDVIGEIANLVLASRSKLANMVGILMEGISHDDAGHDIVAIGSSEKRHRLQRDRLPWIRPD